jgi:uncharacterized membrane protein YbhN (UPF0104 family)
MMDSARAAPRVTRATLRRLLPVAVSTVTLAWVLTRFDVRELRELLSWNVLLVLLPTLLGYGAATLWIEAHSILRLLGSPPPDFRAWTAARIKCASYLLAILNYALGGAALTVLLRRRAGIGLGESASVVLLISLTDLLLVLLLGAVAAATLEAEGPVVRAGVVAVAGVGFFGGLLLLRMPASLGPLERIRSLSVFDALRKAPVRRLAELAALRLLFSICFIGVAGATFYAFDIPISTSRLVVGMMVLAVVGALPIAVAGLGTGQIAAVYVFRGIAPEGVLVAVSLVLSAGLIGLRAGMGLLFAREFTREALEQTRGNTP